MRHGNKNNALGRKKAHRDALLSNLAISLIDHKRIETTLAKAKALRLFVEPLITKSKEDTTHSRRMIFSELQNKDATTTLFRDVAPKVASRPGGYTRIIKLGNRLGDAAEMAMIELVDYNEYMLGTKTDEKKEKAGARRRRGLGRKKTAAGAAPAATTKAASGKKQEKVEEEEAEIPAQPTGEVEEETTDEGSEVK